MMPTILVVEDYAPERRLLETLITSFGYRCLTSSDGSKALELLASVKGSSVDLVILDLGLPDHPGLDLFRSVKTKHPAVGIIVLTRRCKPTSGSKTDA